jgi:hypothetical protein
LRRCLRDAEWLEAPVTDAISPLTAVSLSQSGPIEIPVATPRLFVGVGREDGTGAPDLDRPNFDVADFDVPNFDVPNFDVPNFDVADFDVIVASEDELAALDEACATNPNAVITLVQLLRTSCRLDVARALVAESLAYSTLLGGAEFARWRAARPAKDARRSATPATPVTPVTVADDGETLTITLNRPEVHNAYDAATRDALVDALRSALMLTDERRVELRGNGPSFSSGGDLGEFGTNDDLTRAHLIRAARAPGLLLHRLGARATARVHGACIGAGTELPAFCAHVSARRDAIFRLPEISMGLVPGAGGTVSITRRIGRRRAALLAVSGLAIDASTARRWGLVDALSD